MNELREDRKDHVVRRNVPCVLGHGRQRWNERDVNA